MSRANDGYAGGGIRTHEPLRDEVLSLAPLTRLGYPRTLRRTQELYFKVSIYMGVNQFSKFEIKFT